MFAIIQQLKHCFNIYQINNEKKTFVHSYTAPGLDEDKFMEADKNIHDLIVDYQDKQDAVVDQGCDDEDDEDEDEDEDDIDQV